MAIPENGLPEGYYITNFDDPKLQETINIRCQLPASVFKNNIDLTCRGKEYNISFSNMAVPQKMRDFVPTVRTENKFMYITCKTDAYSIRRDIGYEEQRTYNPAQNSGKTFNERIFDTLNCDGARMPMWIFQRNMREAFEDILFQAEKIEIDLSLLEDGSDPKDPDGDTHIERAANILLFRRLLNTFSGPNAWLFAPFDVYPNLTTLSQTYDFARSGIVEGWVNHKRYQKFFGINVLSVNSRLDEYNGKIYDGFIRGMAKPEWDGATDKLPYVDCYVVDCDSIMRTYRVPRAFENVSDNYLHYLNNSAGYYYECDDNKERNYISHYAKIDLGFCPIQTNCITRLRCFNPKQYDMTLFKNNYTDPIKDTLHQNIENEGIGKMF